MLDIRLSSPWPHLDSVVALPHARLRHGARHEGSPVQGGRALRLQLKRGDILMCVKIFLFHLSRFCTLYYEVRYGSITPPYLPSIGYAYYALLHSAEFKENLYQYLSVSGARCSRLETYIQNIRGGVERVRYIRLRGRNLGMSVDPQRRGVVVAASSGRVARILEVGGGV